MVRIVIVLWTNVHVAAYCALELYINRLQLVNYQLCNVDGVSNEGHLLWSVVSLNHIEYLNLESMHLEKAWPDFDALTISKCVITMISSNCS